MKTEDLKEYLRHAYELETSLNQQKELLAAIEKRFDPHLIEAEPLVSETPDTPFIETEVEIIPLSRPRHSEKTINVLFFSSTLLIKLFQIFLLFLMICLLIECVLNHKFIYFKIFILFLIIFVPTLFVSKRINSRYAKYKHDLQIGKIIDEENRRKAEATVEENERIKQIRKQEILKKKQKNNQTRQKNKEAQEKNYASMILYAKRTEPFKDAIRETKEVLDTFYKQNVIFKKYLQDGLRFVAISSFFEYLSSGRCTSLEGPNGAYNMFEAEHRQNLILTSLADIKQALSKLSDQMEKIRANQFMIYEAIQYGNRTSTKILIAMEQSVEYQRKLSEDATISAYFNAITAQNTEVLKWIESYQLL